MLMPPTLEEVRLFVTPIVCSHLNGVCASDREDICQETWIACWQQLSRREVDDWRAYCATIAHRKVADWFDSKRRRDGVFTPMTPGDLNRAPDPLRAVHGQELERIVFLIRCFFGEHRPECARIVELRYFASLAWEEVAKRVGVKNEAVRQQWQRCRKFLLDRIGKELRNILESAVPDPGVGE